MNITGLPNAQAIFVRDDLDGMSAAVVHCSTAADQQLGLVMLLPRPARRKNNINNSESQAS